MWSSVLLERGRERTKGNHCLVTIAPPTRAPSLARSMERMQTGRRAQGVIQLNGEYLNFKTSIVKKYTISHASQNAPPHFESTDSILLASF